MVDSKENYKFDLGVKGLNVPQTPFEFHSQVVIVESPFLTVKQFPLLCL